MADRHANLTRAGEKNTPPDENYNYNSKLLNDSFSSNIIGTDLILSLMMNDTIMEEASAIASTMIDIPTTESSMAEVLTTDCPMAEEPSKENPIQQVTTTEILIPDETPNTEASAPQVPTAEIPMVEDPIPDIALVESPTTQDPLPENPTTENQAPEISSLRGQIDKDDDELVIGELLENVIKNSSLDNLTDMQDFVPDDNSSPSDFLDYGDDDECYKDSLSVVPHNKATIGAENSTTITTVGEEEQAEPLIQEEELEYIVEKILDKKVDSHGTVKYLVKWQNFTSKDNSWEPLEHLVECDKAMQDFEISRALRLAGRRNNMQAEMAANGIDKANQAALKKRIMPSNHKEFEVNDVMGLTLVNNEKYFLISLANSTQKAFIRASLANTVFPSKVIDFYIKNLRWRPKIED